MVKSRPASRSVALSVVIFLLAAVLVASVGGCNVILGIDDAPLVRPPDAKKCLLNSECADREICLFAVCSPPCAADRDCNKQRGETCLKTAQGSACVSSSVAVCTANGAACPLGTTCANGNCFSDCQGDAGVCPGGQVCVMDHLCRSNPDAGPPGGPDTGVDEQPPSMPDGGEGGAIECGPEDLMRCDGNAEAARSQCRGGKWMATDPCTDGSLCDTTSSTPGQCKLVETSCFGRKPNETFCDGTARKVCGPDLVSVSTMLCPSPQHCSIVSTGCAVCLDNEFSCNGMELRKCNADHAGFGVVKTCTAAAPCT